MNKYELPKRGEYFHANARGDDVRVHCETEGYIS